MKVLHDEFKKVYKANYFLISFIVMFLSPLFTLLILSVNESGFYIGDFNQLNLTFLSLIGSKTIFPVLGMLSIKVENDHNGWAGLFVTPRKRMRYIWIKCAFVIFWSWLLITFSVFVVMITEFMMFNQVYVFYVILESIPSYIYLMFYIVPYIFIGMTLTFVTKSVLIPSFMIIVGGFTGYLVQLFDETVYLPSYISRLTVKLDLDLIPAFISLYVVGFIALFALLFMVKVKDF